MCWFCAIASLGATLIDRFGRPVQEEGGSTESQLDGVDYRLLGPFSMRVSYEFEEATAGTLARIRIQGEGIGFYGLAGPLLARSVKRNITNDLATLKALLESGAHPRIDSQISGAYFNRANTRSQLGQLEGATGDLDEAIRLNPQADAYTARGLAYNSLGQIDRALGGYDEAIRMDPEYALAYANRAILHTVLGEDPKAQEDMYRALDLGADPFSLGPAIGQARSLR